MKKITTFLLVLVLITSAVSVVGAQNIRSQNLSESEVQGAAQGQQAQTEQEVQNQGEQENIMVQQRGQLKAGDTNELKEMIQERQQEMNQEIQSFEQKQQKVYQNQNEVRLAVHSLLAMEDLVGGIGPQVSQIAKDFDNSVQATIQAEEKIINRNMIVRFFAGGNQEAAGEIEREVSQNTLKIQQLKQLREQCDCDEDVKNMFQEQIQKMEQEQDRLEELAQKEKGYGNIFRRMFNWVKSLF